MEANILSFEWLTMLHMNMSNKLVTGNTEHSKHEYNFEKLSTQKWSDSVHFDGVKNIAQNHNRKKKYSM